MKRLTLLMAGFVVMLLAGAAPASADNGPHKIGAGPVADSCGACHRIHTAKAPRLLKEDQVALCFSCHGAGAPGADNDVQSGVGITGGTAGALRGGGFEYALIEANNPSGLSGAGVVPASSTGEKVTSTHSVDSTEQTAWGFGAIDGGTNYGKKVALTCGNCHDPHGNGNYRILRSTPKGLYARTEVAPEVAIADATTKAYTTTNYWLTSDSNGPQFAEKIASWCSICHARYPVDHGGSTPSGDPVYSYRHTSNKGEQGAGKRTCIQCHVSHGSNASMGPTSESVPFPDGSAAGSDSRLLRADNRGVCQICHNK